MKFIFVLLIAISPIYVYAQPESAEPQVILASFVDEPAHFPGDLGKWRSFLVANLHYPDTAIARDIQGSVLVSFIVCEDGSLCDIEAESGPAELRAEAERVMRLSPRWKPALKNKKPVSYRQQQAIIFRLQEEEDETPQPKRQ